MKDERVAQHRFGAEIAHGARREVDLDCVGRDTLVKDLKRKFLVVLVELVPTEGPVKLHCYNIRSDEHLSGALTSGWSSSHPQLSRVTTGTTMGYVDAVKASKRMG